MRLNAGAGVPGKGSSEAGPSCSVGGGGLHMESQL